jgi:hypothetical protein
VVYLISFFPRLYPDELLYSWFARYHKQSGNISYKSTTEDLFGKESYVSTPDLPINLNTLYERLHYFSPSEPIQWVKNHTFFNYYTAFSSKKLRETVLNSMLYKHSNCALHMLTGNMASSVKDIPCFRYCPSCVKEELDMYGEPFLHTSHQLPSCFLCPDHEEILCNTQIPFRSNNKHEFIALKISNCTGNPILKLTSDKVFDILLNISKESKRLITDDIDFDIDIIQNHYKSLLTDLGLTTTKGNIRQNDLAKLFVDYYSEELLSLFQSTIDPSDESCWLKSITRKHRKSFHPARHILFITFLGESIERMSSQNKFIEITQPFGKGPYPCLNAASTHYKEEVVRRIEIKSDKNKKPIGVFYCDCGFVYTRNGPDLQKIHKYKIGRVLNYGDVWLAKLNKLIEDNSHSIRAIGRILNVDSKTVIKYTNHCPEPLPNKDNLDVLSQQHRNCWLKLIKETPTANKTELRYKNPNTYMWLYRHDKEWLNNNSPIPKNANLKKHRINWDLRDAEFADKIIPIVINLFIYKKPKRITTSTIGKKLKKLAIIEQHLDKLPKTKFILQEVTESVVEFQKRRILFSVEQLKMKGEEVVSWRIKKEAGLKSNIPNELENYIHYITKRKA